MIFASSIAFGQDAITHSEGTITFEGAITEASCSVHSVEPVSLGSATKQALDTDGKAFTWGSTTIKFTDCKWADGADDAKLSISIPAGNAHSGSTDLWAIESGGAKNVGLEIEVNNETVKPAGVNNLQGDVKSKPGFLNVPVRARMVASGGAAEPGLVKKTIKFIVNYK